MADAIELLKPLRDKLANNDVPDDAEIIAAEENAKKLDTAQKRQFRIEIRKWISANETDGERDHTREQLQKLAESIPAADLVDAGLETGTLAGERFLSPNLAYENVKKSGEATIKAVREGKWGEAAVQSLEGALPAGVVGIVGLPLIAKQWAAIGQKEGFFAKTGQVLKALLTTGLVGIGAVAAVNVSDYLTHYFRGERPSLAAA
ncbi:MAG: hypothetical protein PHI23_02200 [Candidatus Peribacteraceae bacterium]|nr:hypothetical protein [Candidatus Peribacteraceae bacterium]